MLDDLKLKQNLTRQDIADLLASLGAPGENQDAKIAAVKELNKENSQGIPLQNSLTSYSEF